MYEMERVEIWECFAYGDHFGDGGACGCNHIDRDSHIRGWGIMWVRVEEGELGEFWKRGNIS